MTLETCKKLLEHYEKLIEAEAPLGHVNWGDVQKNAKVRAEEMRKRIERKLKHPKYRDHLDNQEKPKEVKKSGKK